MLTRRNILSVETLYYKGFNIRLINENGWSYSSNHISYQINNEFLFSSRSGAIDNAKRRIDEFWKMK